MVDCKRMSQTNKTYTLGKIKQLIDLNGDSTNFDLSFKVTCHDNTPFYLLVVDQTTLDNTPELKYKEATGSISGNIVADKNIYQNYFLILKSDKTCNVDVELTKKVLPKTPNFPEPNQQVPTGEHMPVDPRQVRRSNVPHVSSKKSEINWKKIGLIALVVVVGLGVLWWLYKRKTPDKNNDKSFSNINEYTLSEHVQSPVNQGNSPVPSLGEVSEGDHESRGYRPNHNPSRGREQSHKTSVKFSRVSPDIMSQASHHSSVHSDGGDDGGNSLLYRLRKFAR